MLQSVGSQAGSAAAAAAAGATAGGDELPRARKKRAGSARK
jgi:hypothetical protein